MLWIKRFSEIVYLYGCVVVDQKESLEDEQ
jgi:hypothetical protein